MRPLTALEAAPGRPRAELRSLDDLADFLGAHGQRELTVDARRQSVRAPLAEGRMLELFWRPGKRSMRVVCTTGIRLGSRELVGAALLAVARVNQELDAPGLLLDLELGTIQYRARVSLDATGGVDEGRLVDELNAALGCVAGYAPAVRALIESARVSLTGDGPTPFDGYGD